MAEGFGAPKKDYSKRRERSQLVWLLSQIDKEEFDSITIADEKDELQSTKKLPTKAKQTKSMLSFTRPCTKYLHASLEKEKMVIDITALRRKKGGIFPIPPLPTEVGQQLPPVSKAVMSFFDPLKSVPQTPVSETPTAITTTSQHTSTSYSSPASSIVGAPPTQQQQQPSANSASSTGHLFGHQSQGTAPFLTQQQQQQQVASLPSGTPSFYPQQQQQQPVSYPQQQQPQSDASYQMSSAYGGQTGYSTTSSVAPPPAASYPQQQYQATPTGGSYSQGYASSRYPSTATPPQPAVPVSSQAYSIYGSNKSVGQQPYQQYQY